MKSIRNKYFDEFFIANREQKWCIIYIELMLHREKNVMASL